MRQPVGARRIEEFLRALGTRFRHPARPYLVGGTTVVLKGLRAQTLDIDLTFEVERAHQEEFISVLRELKDAMDVNVKQVSPSDLIPLPEGFESRAVYVGRYGSVDVYHFDPYSTALSKIERGTEKDFDDVVAMVRGGLLSQQKLEECFHRVMRRYGKESLREDERRFRAHFAELAARLR